MVDAYWLERVLALETASTVVDGLLIGTLVTAVVAGWLTGLTPLLIGLLVVGSIATEQIVSWATRQQILDTADGTGGKSDDRLRETVASLADEMGVQTPRIVVETSTAAGVTVFQDGDGPVVLLTRPLIDDLDESALRAVIAHELAHLDGGHLRFDARDPVAHVVGATAFWIVLGQHLHPVLSFIGLATYVGAGIFRGSVLPQLYYLCASLGLVLVPLGLIAFAHRLQEHRADDRAVAVTTADAFCRGLYHVMQSQHREPLRDDVIEAPTPSEQRGLIARLTATHPPLERRFGRFDVSVDDLAEA